MGEKTLKTAFICAIMLTLISACTGYTVVAQKNIDSIIPPLNANVGEGIAVDVEERNRLVEDDPAWIEESYEGLKLRRLNSVSEKEYEFYRNFLENGSVYIIVHPAYYTFFQLGELSSAGEISKQNAVEKFLLKAPSDAKTSVLQAQERRTRDFLEYKSTEKKLIILVLPRNYAKYKGYTYKNGPDEYTRYLNEVTNLSNSVLFIESKTASRGYLLESDMVRLLEFLLSVKAKKVLVGGGYVGRCLEDFYIDLSDVYGGNEVFVVPELSDVSPKELKGGLADALLTTDGRIDVATATKNMLSDVYGAQEIRPNTVNLR